MKRSREEKTKVESRRWKEREGETGMPVREAESLAS